MITGILSSRVRVIAGSGVSMIAGDLAQAKLSAMMVNAKTASVAATKAVAAKILAKATALWMIVVSAFMPIQSNMPQVANSKHTPTAIVHHQKKVVAPAPIQAEPPAR